jgi:hypothetical protein
MMSSIIDVLTWAAIACGAVAVVLSLVILAGLRPAAPGAASTWWLSVRTGSGVILLSCARWTGGVAAWLLLAAGVWLVLVWNLVSWLRARYRLTRVG